MLSEDNILPNILTLVETIQSILIPVNANSFHVQFTYFDFQDAHEYKASIQRTPKPRFRGGLIPSWLFWHIHKSIQMREIRAQRSS